jgi:xylulokinase
MDLCVIGVDLGTSSCKACLVDGSGIPRGCSSREYPTHMPREGWAEQDPRDWLAAAGSAIRAAVEDAGVDPRRVVGLALTSAAHVAVLADATGAPVRRAILWSDQRSADQARRIPPELQELILARTFNAASATWTLPHLLWIRDHEPRAWDRARRFWLSKDYLLNYLTGASCTDPASAVSSMLYDVEAGSWSDELCSMAGIDPVDLPTVRPPDHVAGYLLPAAAAETGLPAGLPVVNGSLDSATETFCAGAVHDGDLVVRLGTAGGIQRVSGHAIPHRKLISYPHLVAPLWYSQAGTSTAGSAVAWALGALGGTSPLSTEEMASIASSVEPGSDGLLFHPYLAGERCPWWDDRLRGSFTGLSLRHGPGHLARAVLEGICFSLLDASSLLGDLGPAPVRVVGGGTSNPLWVRILCDVLARPVRVLRGASSARGVALFAMSALGVRIERDPTRWLPGDPDDLVPDPAVSLLYGEAFRRYRVTARWLQDLHGRARDAKSCRQQP